MTPQEQVAALAEGILDRRMQELPAAVAARLFDGKEKTIKAFITAVENSPLKIEVLAENPAHVEAFFYMYAQGWVDSAFITIGNMAKLGTEHLQKLANQLRPPTEPGDKS